MSRRTRIAEGVYRDAYGLAATVKVGGVQREKRFHPDENLRVVESWRIQERAALDRDAQLGPRRTGTFTADVARFLTRKAGLVGYKAECSHLKAWRAHFGDWLRSRVSQPDCLKVIAGWQQDGVAIRTIRHRCRLLKELYHGLDGPTARTPLDGVKLPTAPAPQPTAVPLATIRDVAKRLKAAGLLQDYARFIVRATTGQRPAQIMRAELQDIDLKRRVWFVRPAKGGTAVPLPLNAEMVRAWKTFIAADAWGPFDTTTAATTLRAHGWPATVKPYALRHTFAIDLLRSGDADLGDLQGLLGHTSIQTTRQFYGPVLVARLKKATARRRVGL